MEPERFDGLTRRGVGWAIGGLAAVLAGSVAGRDARAKIKKSKRCKKPPLCPKGCILAFTEPGGGRICGEAVSILRPGGQCTQCATRADCGGNAPHCLNSVENLSTGAVSFFTDLCSQYPLGVCGTVTACVS